MLCDYQIDTQLGSSPGRRRHEHNVDANDLRRFQTGLGSSMFRGSKNQDVTSDDS